MESPGKVESFVWQRLKACPPLSFLPRRNEKKVTVQTDNQTDTGFANGDSNLKILFRVTVGGRSSMVEPQIVVLVVAGSSPVGHPDF